MRRACSSDVRSVSFLGRDGATRRLPLDRWVAVYRRFTRRHSPRYRPRRPISAATAGGTRSSIGSPAATRSRISDDETASGVIGNSSIRSGRGSEATTRSSSARSVPGPRRRADARELEHPVGPRPGGERGELVGAEQEDRVVEAERLERVDRARERIERHLGPVDRREGELGEREPDLRRRVDLLVPRVGDDADEQAVEPEVVDRLAGERDVPVVRRVEGAAEDPDAAAHCQIMTSSPISTSEPGLTPAARRASSSSSPSGAVPTTRNPWPVRSTLNRRRSGGLGPVLEEVRQLLRDGRGLLDLLGQSAKSRALSSSMPAPVAHEMRCTATMRSSSTVNGAGSGCEVGLVEDDELRALAEAGTVGGELAVDHAVALVGISLGGVDHVQQQPGPLEMGEKLVPEADPLARALDQARHVRNRQLPAVGAVDRAEHRRQRRERVVGDLRLRVRDPRAGATTCRRSAARRRRRRPSA